MSAEDSPIYNIENEHSEVIVGRTWPDLLYSLRYYIGLLVLAVILYFFRNKIPSIRRISLIVPATVLGLAIGLLAGLREAPVHPPPIIVIQPLTQNTARVFLVRDISALILTDTEVAPVGTTFGSTIRLATRVAEQGNKLVVEPADLHKLALENPIKALAHVRALNDLADKLSKTLEQLIKLEVETQGEAIQRARHIVAELLVLRKKAEKAAREALKEELEEKKSK